MFFLFADCGKLLCFRYYGGMSLSCLAQSEPLIIKESNGTHPKPRCFIRVKPANSISNGIENTAFQDTEQEVERALLEHAETKRTPERHSPDRTDHVQSGVRRKSPNECANSENSFVKGGTKKKVRPNVNAKSPNKEYYQIWTSENPKIVERVLESELDETAPPLPPRALHRPLERSHAFPVPPVVPRHHKPKKISQKPEDSFGFELIDVDEPLTIFDKTVPSNFLVEDSDRLCEKKLKSPKKTIGSDNYITTVVPKNIISSPVKSLETKCSHSSVSNCSSTSSEETGTGVTDASPVIKPHKPLSRQLSNASAKLESSSIDPKESPLHRPLQKKLSSDSSSSGESLEKKEELNNLTGTPLHVPKKTEGLPDLGTPVHRSSSLRGSEPAMPLRPHPRALARVAGIASNLPVCPPTPTHHARKLRNKDSFRPPNLKSFDKSPEFEIVTSPEIKHADIRSIDTLDGWAQAHSIENGVEDNVGAAACEPSLTNIAADFHKTLTKPTWSLKVGSENSRLELRSLGEIVAIDTRPPDVRSQELARPSDNGEASGGVIPLPLRHLTSTRLPSIPERSPRIITLESEHEEPLPPCK